MCTDTRGSEPPSVGPRSARSLASTCARSLDGGRSSPGSRLSTSGSSVRLHDSARAIGSTATNFTTVRFVDTNVLLYAISRDPRSRTRFPVLDITTDLMLAAAATSHRFGVSYWDAAILEAARALGCDLVLSEDLSDGQDYAGVRVQNPFRTP